MTLRTVFSATDTSIPVKFSDVQILREVYRGATFTPSVSAHGVLSWENDQGLENPEPVQVKPIKGVDYFTPDDVDEIVEAVIAAMPPAEGVAF